jgi:hypothetical protein
MRASPPKPPNYLEYHGLFLASSMVTMDGKRKIYFVIPLSMP